MRRFILSDTSGKIRTYNDKRIMTNITVGDYHGGGGVYYIDENYIYIVALADASDASVWGCNAILIGATGISTGSGYQNTQIMLNNGCTTAAGIATGYTDGKYNDWYLPSIYEIMRVYNVFGTSFLSNAIYNTSSEYTSTNNYVFVEYNNQASSYPKTEVTPNVRSVRRELIQ